MTFGMTLVESNWTKACMCLILLIHLC
jgi:hypothetical protein